MFDLLRRCSSGVDSEKIFCTKPVTNGHWPYLVQTLFCVKNWNPGYLIKFSEILTKSFCFPRPKRKILRQKSLEVRYHIIWWDKISSTNSLNCIFLQDIFSRKCVMRQKKWDVFRKRNGAVNPSYRWSKCCVKSCKISVWNESCCVNLISCIGSVFASMSPFNDPVLCELLQSNESEISSAPKFLPS